MSLNHIYADSNTKTRINARFSSVRTAQKGINGATTITVADSGKTFFFAKGAVYTITLPDPSEDTEGMTLKFVVSAVGNNVQTFTCATPAQNLIMVTLQGASSGASTETTTVTSTGTGTLGDTFEMVYSVNRVYITALSGADAGVGGA